MRQYLTQEQHQEIASSAAEIIVKALIDGNNALASETLRALSHADQTLTLSIVNRSVAPMPAVGKSTIDTRVSQAREMLRAKEHVGQYADGIMACVLCNKTARVSNWIGRWMMVGDLVKAKGLCSSRRM